MHEFGIPGKLVRLTPVSYTHLVQSTQERPTLKPCCLSKIAFYLNWELFTRVYLLYTDPGPAQGQILDTPLVSCVHIFVLCHTLPFSCVCANRYSNLF